MDPLGAQDKFQWMENVVQNQYLLQARNSSAFVWEFLKSWFFFFPPLFPKEWEHIPLQNAVPSAIYQI